MKKYRTKSGKVEEKLPGINATVSPSEKVQIAMAGGANTLGDVQTILGQQGKRNNLKGQGAKHIVSFQWTDDDFAGFSPNAPSSYSLAEGTSNIGGLDVSGGIAETFMSSTSDSGDDSGPSGTDVDLPIAKANYPWVEGDRPPLRIPLGTGQGPAATNARKQALASKLDEEASRRDPEEVLEDPKISPGRSPLTFWTDKPLPPIKEEDTFRVIPRSIDRLKDLKEDRGYIIPETEEQREDAKPSYAEKAMDDIARNPLLYLGGTLLSKFVPGLQLAPVGTMLSAAFGKGPGVAGHNNPPGPYSGWQATSPIPKPLPTPDEGGTEKPACPSGSTKSASGICLPITSNNTTLAVVNEKDTRATRKQLRNRPERQAY